MKNEIEADDIYWEMEWKGVPNKPTKEIIFEEKFALAHLLINDIIFINSLWFEYELPVEFRKSIGVFVNCNDVFCYAAADSEDLDFCEIQDLYDHFIKDEIYGHIIWCIKKRKQKPIKEMVDDIRKRGIWNIDEIIKDFED